MNPSNPENHRAGESRPHPAPPPIHYDLAAMLKENPNLCRVIQILRADISYLRLAFVARAAFDFGSSGITAFIDCVDAVDYSIRPPNPTILMGGPLIEFHEQHSLLAEVSQTVPNSDGMEIYDPPAKFGVLVMDQTHIIAGQFALRLDHGNMLKNVTGWKEQERQRRVADLQRGLEWMEPFRLKELKQFTTRSFWK